MVGSVGAAENMSLPFLPWIILTVAGMLIDDYVRATAYANG